MQFYRRSSFSSVRLLFLRGLFTRTIGFFSAKHDDAKVVLTNLYTANLIFFLLIWIDPYIWLLSDLIFYICIITNNPLYIIYNNLQKLNSIFWRLIEVKNSDIKMLRLYNSFWVINVIKMVNRIAKNLCVTAHNGIYITIYHLLFFYKWNWFFYSADFAFWFFMWKF